MAVELKNDLESFYRFVETQLQNGGASLSPEQVLALWRDRIDTIESVRRGIEDVEADRTRTAEDVLQELRGELQDQ